MAAPRKIAVNMRATYMMNSTNLSIVGFIIFPSRMMIMSALPKVGSETGHFPYEKWVLSEKCCVKLQSMGMTSYGSMMVVFSLTSSI